MKHKLLLGVIASGIMFTNTTVSALTGNAAIEFNGNNTAIVGETFVVRMDVKDIMDTNNGVISLEGNLSFDENMVEYISSRAVDAPYQIYINENYNYKIAGLDFSLNNGITSDTTVYEFTFRALQSGNTEITLNNYKLTDSEERITATVSAKNITIKDEVKVTPVKKEVKQETKKAEDVKKTEEVKTVEVETSKETNIEKAMTLKIRQMFKKIQIGFMNIWK